jgi:hypothetical protein
VNGHAFAGPTLNRLLLESQAMGFTRRSLLLALGLALPAATVVATTEAEAANTHRRHRKPKAATAQHKPTTRHASTRRRRKPHAAA